MKERADDSEKAVATVQGRKKMSPQGLEAEPLATISSKEPTEPLESVARGQGRLLSDAPGTSPTSLTFRPLHEFVDCRNCINLDPAF